MKKFYYIILIIFVSTNIVKAVPQLNSFNVLSNFLQNGKIKVYDNGLTEFVGQIGVSRANTSTGYENVEMEITFYAVLNTTETTLKVINITSSQFSGPFLAYYNEEQGSPSAANNLVTIGIPQNLKNSQIHLKYRYKDGNGVWQPNYSPNYFISSTSYNTINVSPLPSKMPIYLVSHTETGNVNQILQLSNTSTLPSGWTNSGIDFKAYAAASSVDRLGAVPIYEIKFKVYDQIGNLGDPKEIIYYSTSQTITTTPFPGYTYQLESTSLAFYAFNSQVEGTIPIYECSHTGGPMQLYLSSDADISDLYNKHIAFYAYHSLE